MYFYYQQFGGEEQWTAVPASHLPKLIEAQHPVLVTVLSVNALVEDLPGDQRDKLSYDGPFYVDWDGADIAAVIPKVHAFAEKLREMDVDLSMCQWYATGGKGFHCTVPAQIFMEKLPKSGTPNLPVIYKELVMSMYVDTIDLRVYSQGRGRMWRQPNVQRPNGRYKVQLTVDEVLNATEETIALLTSSPRPLFEPTPPQFTPKLAVAYARAAQKVEQALKTRGKRKRDPLVREKAASDSVMLMMAGYGLKPGVGFHEVALQITICATTAGMTEQEMLNACGPLIDGHVGDGNRYNTPQRRREELLRLYRYVNDNPMYDFSIGAVKSLLVHSAPDLDGIPVSKEDLRAGIDEAVADATDASAPEGSPGFKAPDEYNDVAGGVTLNKFGIYVATDEGNKRRICAISFEDIHLLMSMETGQLAAYEAEVLVNGRPSGRLTLEVETFQSPQMFNRFCARFGHAMQGTESHLRGAFMRFIELAKKKGKMLYIAKREGLDMVNIPNHEDPDLREPFMVWADGKGVIIDPRVRDKKLQVSFQGFPDPRGLFKTDIDDSPKLSAWLEDSSNREAMRQTLHNMLTCQKPDVLSKLVGWYTACFYRMLFHRAYNKFPVLHVNGAAGAGKTEMNKTMAALFFYNQEPRMLTPQSSVFAIQQHLSASVSIPLILDEYKPHEMNTEMHNKLKLLIRDAYNARDINKGGGTRESDDYRVLSATQLAAPLVFIAEAAEEESAVAERVVLVTVVKPPSSISLQWLARYQHWDRNRKHLTILGKYLASEAINTMSIDNLRKEFDPLFEEARNRFMLTQADLGKDLDDRTLAEKQGAKERSVFNFTVARFGLGRFRRVVESIYGRQEFADIFQQMDDAVYSRMTDLQPATQAEWAKVMDSFATMTYGVDADSPYALRPTREYLVGRVAGREVVELAIQDCYLRYRQYMRTTGSRPLFAGAQTFLHSIKDSPALIKHGVGDLLQRPGVYQFDLGELQKLNVGSFKT